MVSIIKQNQTINLRKNSEIPSPVAFLTHSCLCLKPCCNELFIPGIRGCHTVTFDNQRSVFQWFPYVVAQ